MIFDIDGTFVETRSWMFYEQKDGEEPKGFLDVYDTGNKSESVKSISVTFVKDDVAQFKNVLRRALCTGKYYVQYNRH